MDPRPKLLIVDDLRENLIALEALLRSQGAEVFSAGSGREALELLLVHDFALAIVDVQMPEMDGYELADLMRGAERSKHVPVLFVTAGGRDASHVGRAYASGAVDFMPKPIDAFVLRSKVDVFLRLHRTRAELSRRVAEKERLVEELQQTLRLNELFTAALGHDLRNPLSAIVTAAGLLARRAPDERTGVTAQRITSSAKRMSRMIEQLLDFARARVGGGIPLARREVDLAEICRRIVTEIQLSAPGRDIALTCDGDLRGWWDGDRLGQVISNLLVNALRHGSEHGAVSIALEDLGDGRVRLAVGNEGAIPPDTLPTVFDPFHSGRRNSRSGDGLGLGLYIVREIVRAHGGDVLVASSPKEGTRFTVLLPASPVRSPTPPPDVHTAGTAAAP
jgi:signal transduction histidine kinase